MFLALPFLFLQVCSTYFFYFLPVNSPDTAPERSDVRSQALDILVALSMDARTDYLQVMATKSLTRLLGDNDSETRQLREHLFVLRHTYNLIIEYTNDAQDPAM